MPKLSTLKSLGSLFRSSINSTPATTTSAAAKTSPAVDKSLKHFVSSLDASSASTFKRTLVKSQKRPQPSKHPSPAHFSSLVSIRAYTYSRWDYKNPTMELSHYISSLVSDGLSDSEGDDGEPSEEGLSGEELAQAVAFEDAILGKAMADELRKNEISNWEFTPLERKKLKYVFKKDHVSHFVNSCVVRLGIDPALNLFRKLGREISMEEFDALSERCMRKASSTADETVVLEQVSKVFKVFMSMREQGFQIKEESYCEVLLYLIDKGMVEQFHLFSDVIKNDSASTRARLGYYEGLLYKRSMSRG